MQQADIQAPGQPPELQGSLAIHIALELCLLFQSRRNPCLCLSQMKVAQPSQTTSARKRFREPCHPAARSVDGRPLYDDVSQAAQRRRYFREYRRDQRAGVVRPAARAGRPPAGDAAADATDQMLISTVPKVMGHTVRQSTRGTKQTTVSRKAPASGRAKGRAKVKAKPIAKPHANTTVRPRARAKVNPPAACSHRKLPCCGQRVSRCKCIFQVVCSCNLNVLRSLWPLPARAPLPMLVTQQMSRSSCATTARRCVQLTVI